MSSLTSRFIANQRARTNDGLAREIKGKTFEEVLADHNRRDLRIHMNMLMQKPEADDADFNIPIPSQFAPQPITVKDWTAFVSHGATLFIGVLITSAAFIFFGHWIAG
jgi:hypothetical protein